MADIDANSVIFTNKAVHCVDRTGKQLCMIPYAVLATESLSESRIVHIGKHSIEISASSHLHHILSQVRALVRGEDFTTMPPVYIHGYH